MGKINICDLIKQIEGDGLRVVNVRANRYGDLYLEVSRGGDFCEASKKYNGTVTNYGGQDLKVTLCRRA